MTAVEFHQARCLQPIESYSHEEEHIETAAELGYGLDKNQMMFGF
ncbi:MAG TPA: hypothetical protein PKY73_17385 [Hyphomonas sp.]|nr:hypothetical protein [Hyphomonas sp.]